MSSLTKSRLIEVLAGRYPQLAARDMDIAVKTVLEAMTEALVQERRIEIRGFGSFSLSRRRPRVGRNPRSGEKVLVPAKRVPHFKPGKALREQVNGQRETHEAAAAAPVKKGRVADGLRASRVVDG